MIIDEVAEFVFIDVQVWTRRESDGQRIYLGTARFRRAATLFNRGRPEDAKIFQRAPVHSIFPPSNGPEGTLFWTEVTITPDVTTMQPVNLGGDQQ